VSLRSCLEAEVSAAHARNGRWSDLDTLAMARLGLGTHWDSHTSAAAAADLATSRLVDQIDSLGTSSKAALALALLLPTRSASDSPDWARIAGSSLPPGATAVLRYLSSSIRIRGRSAYLSSGAGSDSDAGATATAYALAALAAARAAAAHGAPLPPELTVSIDKLADGLAAGNSQGYDTTRGPIYIYIYIYIYT